MIVWKKITVWEENKRKIAEEEKNTIERKRKIEERR